MRTDFEETLQKIDEELGVNSVTEDSVSIPVTVDAPFENPLARDPVSLMGSAQVVKSEGPTQPIGPILLPDSRESPQKEKKGKGNGPKPIEQGTWVRLTRATKNPNKEAEVRGSEFRREPIQNADPRPSKCPNSSQDDVLCSILAAVADAQPCRTP